MISAATRDLLFRGLFSTIFVGLGFEHVLDDRLIRRLMPSWVDYPELCSFIAGVILLVGGLSILLGYKVRWGATVLGAFLIVVTVTVHLPGVFETPQDMTPEWAWLWTVFQRSNLVKNLCLLGVCIHLTQHEPGRYSVDSWLERQRQKGISL